MHAERGPSSRSLAFDGHAAAVQFDELPRQGKPDTEARDLDVSARLAASEELKDALLHLWRNAKTSVADRDDGLRATPFCAHADAAASRRVLRSVVEQVLEHL